MILSEKEKKALKNMRIFARVHEDMTIVTAEDMNVVLNIIEKQQKEIEELKEKNKILEAISLSFKEIQDRDKKWEDKIKAKIE